MEYEVTREDVTAAQIAAVHDQATFGNLPSKIWAHVDTVLTALRTTNTTFGRCVVLYWDQPAESSLLATPAGVAIDVGWEVEAPFTDPSAGVLPVQTPAGTVVRTTHVGSYANLPQAHEAIRRWCAQTGASRVGPNWEIYDHPRAGTPARTHVYYLVR